MDEKLLILLGLGTIGYLAATNFNCDDDDDDEEDDNEEQNYNPYMMQQQMPCNQIPYFENYTQEAQPVQQQPQPEPYQEEATVSYQNAPVNPFSASNSASPLQFGSMIEEKFTAPSDYSMLDEYGKQDSSLPIPVYNEKDGTTSLPVSDMTDMSAGEQNKYIYDRTIGTIGFTSTKIGGRRRGQADYIRGDLPILPDRSPWFQVSSDPLNTLVDGALGNQNALGNGAPAPATAPAAAPRSAGGGQRAMRRITATSDAGEEVELGTCDDEDFSKNPGGKPYLDCIYDLYQNKLHRQPTMAELKKGFALASADVNSSTRGMAP